MDQRINTRSPVRLDLRDGVLNIVLNDPAKRNALSVAMLDALHHALDDAADHGDVRVVVISAEGPVFCAGHNLAELTEAREHDDGGRAFFADTMRKCSAMMMKIVHLPKPVIADVRGVATAAGCQLVASCDLAYATRTSQFATPGVNIGLFCSTPMVALSRNVSNKFAMEMLLTGDMVTAERAAEIGLINQAVADDEIDAILGEVTAKILAKSMRTLKIGKEAFYRQKPLDLSDAYDYCSKVMVENMMTEDANEGIRAFLEKRPPEWTDQ